MVIKMLLVLMLAVSWGWVAGYEYDCTQCQPEHVHIAFGEKSNEVVITWSTVEDTNASVVMFGIDQLSDQVVGARTMFVDGGYERRAQYIHRATLRDLQYDTTYVYNVGSDYGVSELFKFNVPPEGTQWLVRAAIYGDMGSLSFLQREAEEGHFDVILHVGDFAYDMHSDNARVGDQFMRQIQPIAAMVPYMTCPGNHEAAYNFSNYRARFSMPGGTENMYYSFDLGPVHFVFISTEWYYEDDDAELMLPKQYNWLERDLNLACEEENRASRPWIVVMGHRPMYCSNSERGDAYECKQELSRTGHPVYGHGLEPLLVKYGVDIVIWAHEHSYERLWPIYNYTVHNGSLEEPYVNPRAPVHVVTGSAGCEENLDPYDNARPDWSAFRAAVYGYTRFIAYNNTHVYMEQLDVERGGEVVDSFWVVKDTHGEYRYD